MTFHTAASLRVLASAALALGLGAATATADIAQLIPRPQSVTPLEGSLARTPVTDVRVRILPHVEGVTSPEGYRLTVAGDSAVIEATDSAGAFYARQTLRAVTSPVVVVDNPRLPYRGAMLDVSRHFRPVDWVLKQIDALADLRINHLHLHLTDAAGWRLEIDGYPSLTQYAAWRPDSTWREWAANGASYGGPYGGFYTRQDIDTIVRHAASRHITVVPEIEMPSHSEEVTAAYPWLACNPGQRAADLCVGEERTFTMLQDVLDQVMEMFPSPYIHIAGDEAGKGAWAHCPKCQHRMAQEGIDHVDGLQNYMITRISDYLRSHGRTPIGWDEISQGGGAPEGTVVMLWRGQEHLPGPQTPVILSPGNCCYLDSYQDAPNSQPAAFGGYTPLEKVYTLLDPSAANVIGVQGNEWAEYIPTDSHAEYMLYPRMAAIAEVGWTPAERLDYADFRPRAKAWADSLAGAGYTVFDLSTEVGNRPEALEPVDHLARGAKITYNRPWWGNWPSTGATALVDGLRGGWNYNDQRWQGFVSGGMPRLDVTIDLGEQKPVSEVTATFMQICQPDVWLPTDVEISLSTDGQDWDTVARHTHEQAQSDLVEFKDFGWQAPQGQPRNARYVHYVARAPKGVTFTDEIIVR